MACACDCATHRGASVLFRGFVPRECRESAPCLVENLRPMFDPAAACFAFGSGCSTLRMPQCAGQAARSQRTRLKKADEGNRAGYGPHP